MRIINNMEKWKVQLPCNNCESKEGVKVLSICEKKHSAQEIRLCYKCRRKLQTLLLRDHAEDIEKIEEIEREGN